MFKFNCTHTIRSISALVSSNATSIIIALLLLSYLYALPSEATTAKNSVGQTCQSELIKTGYSASVKDNQFCQALRPPQWGCAQIILQKYRSLELAKDICLQATNTESLCFTQVISRNFDPYTAKRVCRLKKA